MGAALDQPAPTVPHGRPSVPEEFAEPEAGADQTLNDVSAAGINYAGTYQRLSVE